MKSVAIIGGGFSGAVTAVNLMMQATSPLAITIINDKKTIAKGIAYDSYSNRHTLNVMAGKMSIFPDEPMHFVDWLQNENLFEGFDKEMLSKVYVSRNIYGKYVVSVYEQAKLKKAPFVTLTEVTDTVCNVTEREGYELELQSQTILTADIVILATGNKLPSHPTALPEKFVKTSKRYFQNPWEKSSVSLSNTKADVLIIGNGLTMVDTVQGLIEMGHHGRIYSLSPNGFAILPHRHNGLSYTNLIKEIQEPYSLRNLVTLFNRHVKRVRHLGLSAEPVIDSIRPLTQKIWISLSLQEKKFFMKKLRHLWGVARHRLPIHIYDQIIKLKLERRLHIIAGKLLEVEENEESIGVKYLDKRSGAVEIITVDRIINCTGPNTDISSGQNMLFINLLKEGIVQNHEMKMGLNASPEGKVMNRKGEYSETCFAIGNLMKSELWESTAVPELRTSARLIASLITERQRVERKIL